MKQYSIILCTIGIVVSIFILMGCNKTQEELGDSYREGQDQQFMFCNKGLPSITRTEKGYYFFSGEYLYYADFESMEPIIMCNKPNCLHNDETDIEKRIGCNALFVNRNFLTYYDGYLYTTADGYKSQPHKMELVKVSLDGTSRKKVFEFDTDPRAITIHRGKLYYSSTVFDKEGKAVYGLQEIDLERWNAQPRILYTGDLSGGSIQNIMCYGNHVYFTEITINKEVQILRAMHYDTVQDETTRLFTEDDDLYPQALSIINGEIYYIIFNGDYYDHSNRTVYKADLDGSNNYPCFELEEFASISSDGTNLIVEDLIGVDLNPEKKNSVSLCTIDGRVLGEMPIDTLSRGRRIFSGDENYIFITDTTDGYYEIKTVNKQKMKSGELEIKDFFRIEEHKLIPELLIKN